MFRDEHFSAGGTRDMHLQVRLLNACVFMVGIVKNDYEHNMQRHSQSSFRVGAFGCAAHLLRGNRASWQWPNPTDGLV